MNQGIDRANMGSDDLDRATFLASIPNIMTGLKMGGDGCRAQFDIPETEMGQAIKLVGMRGKRLKVTVEIVTNRNYEAEKEAEGSGDKVDRRRSANRRDKRPSG